MVLLLILLRNRLRRRRSIGIKRNKSTVTNEKTGVGCAIRFHRTPHKQDPIRRLDLFQFPGS